MSRRPIGHFLSTRSRTEICRQRSPFADKDNIGGVRHPPAPPRSLRPWSQHQNAAHYRRFELCRVSRPYLDRPCTDRQWVAQPIRRQDLYSPHVCLYTKNVYLYQCFQPYIWRTCIITIISVMAYTLSHVLSRMGVFSLLEKWKNCVKDVVRGMATMKFSRSMVMYSISFGVKQRDQGKIRRIGKCQIVLN